MSGFKSVLITGGTGNIGSQLVSDLLDDAFQVITTSHSDNNIKIFKDKFSGYYTDGFLHLIKVVVAKTDVPVGEELRAELMEVELRPETNVALMG